MRLGLGAAALAIASWGLITAAAAMSYGTTAWLISGGLACAFVAVMILGLRGIVLVALNGALEYVDRPEIGKAD